MFFGITPNKKVKYHESSEYTNAITFLALKVISFLLYLSFQTKSVYCVRNEWPNGLLRHFKKHYFSRVNKLDILKGILIRFLTSTTFLQKPIKTETLLFVDYLPIVSDILMFYFNFTILSTLVLINRYKR